MAAARRRPQAYRAALVKCFCGPGGSRAQASVRRTGAKRRNVLFETENNAINRTRGSGQPACRRQHKTLGTP